MINLEEKICEIMEKGGTEKVLSKVLEVGLKNTVTRRALLAAIEKAIHRLSLKGGDRPRKVFEERYYMGRALLHSLRKVLDSGSISKNCFQALGHIFLGKVFVEGIHQRKSFADQHGFRPPCFVTISPTNVCNLKCKGCYAGEIYTKHTLKYPVLDRVISEIKEMFGAHFFVISGGEPFMYRDDGVDILALLEKHPDAYFMAYTNGTMITREVAGRLAELGNFTPAISVEGFEQETDARRGKGVHRRIVKVMEQLKEVGVPFGVSVTPTRGNADLLLSDEFINFYFQEMGAFYGWYFQYMPIGREPSMDAMVTPEQRLKMFKRIWKLVIEDRVFIADFWNSGTASDGCMAAARGGGYFYIMWDGTITPCVFIPFKDPDRGNLYALYENGKTIVDAIKSPLFERIRNWQFQYWINQPKENCGNLLAPCIIRDNAERFYRIVKETGAQPLDEGASAYLALIEKGCMPEYNRCYRKLVDPLWENEYLRKAD